jgi:hypothetical protein
LETECVKDDGTDSDSVHVQDQTASKEERGMVALHVPSNLLPLHIPGANFLQKALRASNH